MTTKWLPLHNFRSLLAVVTGAALVMIPAGILYSASFIALNAMFPALGFSQASPSVAAAIWRIVVCLLCAAAGGYATQAVSKEDLPLSVTLLAFGSLVAGLLDFHSSGLYRNANTGGHIALTLLLAVVIYEAGRLAAPRTLGE